MLRALAFAALLAFAPVSAVAQQPSALYINTSYDPRANPYRDLDRAIDRALAEDKRILIVVGGDWCGWCRIFDDYLQSNTAVRAAFEDAFVIVKVNRSPENPNVAFLSGFPVSQGYPDFLILDSNGAYLGRQRNNTLDDGRNYDRARMLEFAERWRR